MSIMKIIDGEIVMKVRNMLRELNRFCKNWNKDVILV
jgi:hypothetical protein